MRLTQHLVITSLILIISLAGTSEALEYISYIFTTKNVIFFSYQDGTELELYTSTGQPVPFQPNILDKGEHVRVVRDNVNEVYKVCGSNKFAVLTGDPAIIGGGVSGYYAMDANGLGTSTEFYTYVPKELEGYPSAHELFIVFAYEPNSTVTVQEDVSNGNYVDVATFTLDKGQHWATPDLSDKWLHVIADKAVSALSCYDQGYFVPSANGRWSGTEFYTYVSDTLSYHEDLTVIAYDNATYVTITDSNDPNIVIWSGTLNRGKAYVKTFPGGADQYFTITSSKPVTVSVQPWKSYPSDYHQGVFIPDRDGTGIGRMGRDLIGSTLSEGYLYILAHTDGTHVDLYSSENGSWVAGYTLNEGGAVNDNPGNGLWRIVSDRYVSAYSGFGSRTAEFAPLAFDAKPGLLDLNKIAAFEGTCVLPGDEITYTITYGPNGVDHNNVVITDYLPCQVDYINPFDPNYDDVNHTYKWQIGSLSASAPNDFVTLTVYVNLGVEPNGIITNYCEIESDIAYSTAEVNTPVCCWGGDIIYVDKRANGSNSGTSWSNAYTDLQSSLERARQGCGSQNQIWVAEGTYEPTKASARSISFELLDDVAVYGGFPPGGGQRNPNAHHTILSGDIGIPGDASDNSYHVVKCENANNAILDGFTITGGKADGSSDDDKIGGGIYCKNSNNVTITRCIITGNSVVYSGGGLFNNSSDPHVTNCIFTGNTAGWYGGGMHNYQCLPVVINCIFCGNCADSYGGGMADYESCPTLTNCTFSGNWADWGGGLYNLGDSDPNITNCTFSGNLADYGGGMYNGDNSDPNVTNCIFWDNVTDEISGSAANVTYSDVNDGYAGAGNIDIDPCFVDVDSPTGSWTADASFDSSTCQSTLTDSYAYWSVNELAGKFVNPDTLNQNLQFFIVSNDVNTIKVWSDVTAIAGINDTYEILDYHLSADSNCIDAGDPCFVAGPNQTDIDGEDRVIYDRVDMGADEYYWSPADFNNDGLVNFFDYALFASAWQSEPNDDNYNEDCDLEDNNSIDYNDLALFCEDWLWQTAWAKAFPCSYGQGMGRGMGLGMSESLSLTEELYPSAPAKQAQPELTAADIEEILKWLEELWLTDDELRKMISEDEWLKLMEAVIQALKEQIYN